MMENQRISRPNSSWRADLSLGRGFLVGLCLVGNVAGAGAQSSARGDDECLTAPQMRDRGGTAFIDVTVVPMDRERLLQKRTVLVHGCRIEAIGHRDSVEVPLEYERIVGGDDVFLLPGLVDAHTHLRYDGDLVLYAAGGVTTVRNMEGSPAHLRWKQQVREGAFGPRILTAGPTEYARAETLEEVTRAVDSMTSAGFDFVKVFDPLASRTYEWLIAATDRAGLPVAGHIPRAIGARKVLEQRSHQTIEHAEQFVYHWFYDDLDWTRIPELVAQVKRSGAAVTPTLEVIHSWIGVVESLDSLLSRPETRWLHPETYAYWHTFERGSSFENRLIAGFQQDIVLELARQGAPLLLGTDVYMVGLNGPWALRREMRRMREAGLSPYEVLRAATATPAAVFGYDAGTILEGQLADLLLVRGNPLRDLSVLDEIEGVMLDGAWHPGAELASRLDSIEAAYAAGNAFVNAALGGQVDRAVARHRELKSAEDDRRAAPSIISYVASILRRNGRYDDAIALYQLALEEDSAMASAHEGIARTYLAVGRIPDAVAALERALEIEPGRAQARELLAQLRD
jgi:hypothetical protein